MASSMPQQKGLKNDKSIRWRVAEVMVVGLFMAVLDTTIVSVTLPQMQQEASELRTRSQAGLLHSVRD